MFVMYYSPGKGARWLLGLDLRMKEADAPPQLPTVKREIQRACERFEIKHRRQFSDTGRPFYKISGPVLQDWFEKRYQSQEAISEYSCL